MKKNRLIILLLIINSFLWGQISSKSSYDIELQKAIDYYSVNLIDKAKANLIELLYSGVESADEAEIRYHLGLCSYFQGDKQSAINQWEKMGKKYPSHRRTDQVREFVQTYIAEKEQLFDYNLEIIQFNSELRHSLWFWTPINPNEKFYGGELKEPGMAYKYYSELFNKYDDPEKKFLILYYKFRLLSGYNNDNYGYKNEVKLNNPREELVQNVYKNECQDILNSLEQLILDIDNPNIKNKLIESNYLWALKLSDSKLFSTNVKVNQESEIYFNKVINLTSDNTTNIYRTFSKHWLKIK